MTTADPLDLPAAHPPRTGPLAALPPRARVFALARSLSRHRLAQFAALGGLIFAIAPRPAPARDISLRHQSLAALHAAEAGRERLPAVSPEKAREIDQRALEDEILFREGVRLGLDRDDGIVRQRVVQKALFFAEELGGASRPPTDAELRAFFAQHRDRWIRPARVHFVQIFAHEKSALPGPPTGPVTGPIALGEAAPVAPELDADPAQLTARFGQQLAGAIVAMRPGAWSDPVQSSFGWHLIHVVNRREGHPARFEEVRASVAEQFDIFRRQEAVASFLTSAFARYRVSIDDEPRRDFTPSRRVAFHAETSGED